ncbi:NAD-dependent epimerase/dehydratase family protein [Streptomyces hokutonensis]|uniref:NAD-dependent epimerase/dehydratase family protein n=1 Tax=Streptomyces hokutonensis TaxID=1306990 RepID=UPI0003A9AFE7|nr:NAD-dependent epimerase/dehydratase family protein [Streptomyces hokutonensis]
MSNVRRALVTGGAGFVGSHLCEHLLSEGLDVVCVDNFCTGRKENLRQALKSPRFQLVTADVTELPAIEGPLDWVFHLASPASPVDYHRLPLETLRTGSRGTENVLICAVEKQARFLLASTSEVYGDPLQHPQREDYFGNVDPIGPRAVYDEAKRYAEAATMAYRRSRGANTTIARIFNTYGPRMRELDGRVVPTFISQALAGMPFTINGSGTQTRSLCYVTDLVTGLVALMVSDTPGPVNLGNPYELTVLEIAKRIAAAARAEPEVVHRPLPMGDPLVRQPDIGRAQKLLGWTPEVPVDEGLGLTVEWYRTRGSRSC